MNLRILKKLSKRAAPLLPLLGDVREQFRADDDCGYVGLQLMDRTCWERGRSVHNRTIREHEIKKPAADGNGWIRMAPPDMAARGTLMVGSTCGYYEPEWYEESAWEALQNIVRAEFTNWECADGPILTRRLRTPSDVLKAAADLIRWRSSRCASRCAHRNAVTS